jgi:hypothetical protein
MSPTESAKLLDLPADATPEQLEARFLELRRKLEDKIAKAPTPGLQAKYRESLTAITTAFETLTLAADSSSLPVTTKQSTDDGEWRTVPNVGSPLDGGPGSKTSGLRSQVSGLPAAKRPKSGGKEFTLVAIIAVLLLAGGGWFVMKTRADNAEAARVAAEALQKKQADEKTEAARVNALKTSLRTKLAEVRVDWEAHESGLQDAERQANELKSELRSLRDAPAVKRAELSAQVTAHELYARWLKNHLLRHPAKLARVRAEELLQAGAYDEASAVTGEITAALAALTEDINYRREYFFKTTVHLRLDSQPAGVEWFLTDAHGRTHAGRTPAQLAGLPLTHFAKDGVPVAPFETEQAGEFTTGKISVVFLRTGWPDVVQTTTAVDDRNAILEASFPEGGVTVSSQPSGLPFVITQPSGGYGWTTKGTTPATVTGVPPGSVRVTITRAGYADVSQNLEITAGQTAKTNVLDQRSQPVHITVAEKPARITVDGKTYNGSELDLATLPPGDHALILEINGHKAYRTKFSTVQRAHPLSLSYSFKELSAENITCRSCSGAGKLNHQERCRSCNGSTLVDCPNCENGVSGYTSGEFAGGVIGQKSIRCTACNGKGKLGCTSCSGGIIRWQSNCTTCSGDGKLSQLQLSP